MWKSKKFILLMMTVALLVVGVTAGAVMAATTDDGGDTTSETQSQHEAMLDRLCEIYEENTGVAIDPDELQNALDQARNEIREQAITDRLQALVDDGRLTQDEADQYLEWLQSKPDINVPGLMGSFEGRHHGGGMMDGDGFGFFGGGTNCAPDDSSESDA